jgi:hypothetical protein
MKGRVAASLSALCLLGAVESAWADAPPVWCKGELADHKISISGGKDQAFKDDPTWAIYDIVAWMCHPDTEATQMMPKLEEARQSWSKRLFMTDDEWTDAATWASYRQSERSNSVMYLEGKPAWSSLDGIDQYILLQNIIGKDYDANYIADALDGKLTEVGRFGFSRWCLGHNNKEVQWAMCQPDIDAFDPKKIAAELHADKSHNGYERMMIRLWAYAAVDQFKEHAAAVKSAVKNDPAYGKMMELAAAARKEWDARAKSDASLRALALAMDDARVTNSRKAYADCDDTTWAAFKTAVGAIPAKKFTGIHDEAAVTTAINGGLAVIAGDPAGYLASIALFLCHAGDSKRDPLVRNIADVNQRWPGFRGPRNAAHLAILQAGLTLDDRSAKIDYPAVYRQWLNDNRSSSGGGAGAVAAVKPQGDKVRIEFAKQMVKETRCLASKRTNRITQIRSDGTLVYEVNCLKEGTVMVDTSSAPVTVNKRYVQGLKPGMGVSVIEDVVGAAWLKAGAKVPSMVAGVAVK